jgi:hypothetical protein
MLAREIGGSGGSDDFLADVGHLGRYLHDPLPVLPLHPSVGCFPPQSLHRPPYLFDHHRAWVEIFREKERRSSAVVPDQGDELRAPPLNIGEHLEGDLGSDELGVADKDEDSVDIPLELIQRDQEVPLTGHVPHEENG